MSYTTINKSGDYFNTKLYSGDNSTGRSITGVGFAPDFLWLKDRTTAGSAHFLSDSVRGDGKWLRTNGDFAENTDTNVITSLDSDGFTVGNDVYSNKTGDNYVAWNWKANGAGSANTDGDINSTVSASATSGFSIVKYSGNSTSNQTIGHGLGSTPKMIIIKRLTNTNSWITYHSSLGATAMIFIDQTSGPVTSAAPFNNTAPTNSVFTVDGNGGYSPVNLSGEDYIAYCFAEKTGYSKFGSYVGNGSTDGAFVYTGMKPAFVIIRKNGSFGSPSWQLFDNKRVGYNQDNHVLRPNLSDAECTSCVEIDILSNGFKLRNTDGDGNTGSGNYIYMAFGQSLVGSNNVPCTAR